MKTLTVLLLLTAPLAAQVGAEADAVTLPGKFQPLTLRQCKVTKVEPDGVRVMHSTGMAKVPWEHMPAEWKAGMYYDPAAAAVYREKNAPAAVAEPPTPANVVSGSPVAVAGLLTREQVKASWLAAADPSTVSGLHNDGKREVVSSVKNVAKARSKFKGAAGPSDAEKARQAIEEYRQDIIAGKHDLRAERVAVENNLAVYTAAGDVVNAAVCRERLEKLPK
jgi:hypothetical protein